MFSAIRRRLRVSPTTVIATLALVFAMTGGAYAAKRYLITSTKQISPSVLKALQGKAGAAGSPGAAGVQGAQGPQGSAGANGKDGAPGSNGASVASSVEPAGAHCKAGGSKFVAASGTTYACNGENGQTGFTETLPSEKSERGVWSAFFNATEAGQLGSADISFNIPLEAPLPVDQPRNFIGPEEGEGEAKENKTAIPSHCKGTVANPQAVAGNLCVFARVFVNAPGPSGVQFTDPQGFVEQAGLGGAVILLSSNEAGLVAVDGDWVVTAK